MRDYLHPFENELRKFAEHRQDIVEQGILLWNMIYYAVNKFQETHPDYILVRHEDLSRNPLEEFEGLSTRLNVEFTPEVRRRIAEYSNANNPVEAQAGVRHQLKRNSVANIKNWQSRLSPDEIERIREGVHDVAHLFYSDSDWE